MLPPVIQGTIYILIKCLTINLMHRIYHTLYFWALNKSQAVVWVGS